MDFLCQTPESYWVTALASVLLYIVLIFGFRLLNKRGLSDLKIPDLILLIIIGESIGSIIPNNNQICHALVCILSLFAANFILDKLIYKNKWFDNLVEGDPVLLIHNCKIMKKNLKKTNLTEADLHEVMRLEGISDLNEVKQAVLETDGKISIIRNN